jgi:general secretion pathway protein G
MVRNIVTGKTQKAVGTTQKAADSSPRAQFRTHRFLPAAYCRLPFALLGFTLLELMIVITVIIILAAIVLPQYQKTILATREAVLREDLFNMRKLLDQYAADKQKLPQSLDDLVSGGYLREIPKDPITGQADWAIETGEDPNSDSGEQGVTNVRSASTDTSSEGTPYNEW